MWEFAMVNPDYFLGTVVTISTALIICCYHIAAAIRSRRLR